MSDDWITLGEAEILIGRPRDEVNKLITDDNVEVIYVQDNKNRKITLIPREYAEKKGRELNPEKTGTNATAPRRPRKKPEGPQETVAEPVAAFKAEPTQVFGPVAKLSEVITDRYEAIVTALRTSDTGGAAIQQNLKDLTRAFEVTTQAIDSMREIQRETTAGFEVTLSHQNQIMENLLTSLQKADKNTDAVKRYQQDFIDAINRLPEPLQAIQDVQLGLIELEEKRMQMEKHRVRFDQTNTGRIVTLGVYILGAIFLIVGIIVGIRLAFHLPQIVELLKHAKP